MLEILTACLGVCLVNTTFLIAVLSVFSSCFAAFSDSRIPDVKRQTGISLFISVCLSVFFPFQDFSSFVCRCFIAVVMYYSSSSGSCISRHQLQNLYKDPFEDLVKRKKEYLTSRNTNQKGKKKSKRYIGSYEGRNECRFCRKRQAHLSNTSSTKERGSTQSDWQLAL